MRGASVCGAMLVAAGLCARAEEAPSPVLKADDFRRYVEAFNRDDRELDAGAVSNASAWAFLRENMPLLDCPDEEIQRAYYFRWWTYRKHLKRTPAGWVVDEFLPNVPWAGAYNSISCAAGHHLAEGRWLRDPQYLRDYAAFWFGPGGDPRRYSFWAADAVLRLACVSGDFEQPKRLLPALIANYEAWEKTHRDANGLYWQVDDRDGMECSISGDLHPKKQGYRATINSYQFGDALAIARIAERVGQPAVAREYREKAAAIKKLVQEKLWDADAQFFKVIPRGGEKLSDARELHGFTPWYFELPDPQYAVAWKQVMDPQGFLAPFGLTSAEQRHPKYAVSYAGHECQWNGPVWPFSTSITLTGLANLLNGPAQDTIGAKDYFGLLRTYAKAHQLRLEDGRVVPWIDEVQNPTNGDWISRTILNRGGAKIPERGKDYNHSTFCDLVISGLIGLRPRADNVVEVRPLVPEGAWDYFCLDRVRYHGHDLTVLFDKSGARYGKGKGLRVLCDGQEIAAAAKLERVTGALPGAPETAGGWRKFEGNPVMGGQYGTCFDIAVLREGGKYRMWLSWRPKKSIALVESADGIRWSEPPQIVLGPRPETGWEDDINRPVVVKRADGYHLWYTGQVKGKSCIGYATSADGVSWVRRSDKPVLVADAAWEQPSVMCPHVLWDEAARQYRLWYSGGNNYEPDAIGTATSADGLTWVKHAANPIFRADPASPWERERVTACQVEKRGDGYLMFYIGFSDIHHAQIGLARSSDGITGWQRHPDNPIVRPGYLKWDHDACYKPYAIFDGAKWLLWYNGRHGNVEQIGAVVHEGEDLGFGSGKAQGLVGCWRFDGCDGKTVRDSSGAGNDGEIASGELRKERGTTALELDGMDGCVRVAPKKPFALSTAITAVLWVNPAKLKNNTVLFGVPNAKPDWATPVFGMYLSGNHVVYGQFGDKRAPKALVESKAELEKGRWTCLTATSDGASLRLYVDGALDAELKQPSSLGFNGQPLLIGAGLGGKPSLKGRVGELRLYDRALPAEEVRALYESMRPAYGAEAAAAAGAPRDGTVIVETHGNNPETPGPWRAQKTRLLELLKGYVPSGDRVRLDAYGGCLELPREKATGYFRTQKIGGRWWLIDPEGYRYYNVGINTVREPKAVDKNFGGAERWAEQTTARFRENGFNGLGNGSSTALQKVKQPLVWVLRHNFLFAFAREKGLVEAASGTQGFPNRCMPVFDPAFPAFCERYGQALAATANDPTLLGIMTENEIQCPVDLLDRYLGGDASDPNTKPGHDAAAAWLAARKGTADPKGVTRRDRYEFIAYAFERYYGTVVPIVRKYDPNHLYLGSRINYSEGEFDNPWFWKMMARHHDVVSVNYYGRWGAQADELGDWATWADRPILFTEWYAKALDAVPKLANTHGAGWVVRTQEDRARYYQQFALNALETPNVVGWHYFKYMDDPPESKALDNMGGANKGMFDVYGQPHKPVLDRARAVNREVYPLIGFFDARNK